MENDLPGTLAKLREGWTDALAQGGLPWAMLLLDLCFYTGRVSDESHRRTPGMPEGRPGDDDPRSYSTAIQYPSWPRKLSPRTLRSSANCMCG